MRRVVLLFCLSLFGCVFFAVPKELQCQDGDAPSCDGSVLVRCEAGIKVRLDCGDLQCDASRDSCGICGDGLLTAGEVCDDQNTANGDGCRSDCLGLEACGDGLIDVGEVCDDGNNLSGDGCNSGCSKIEVCGDGSQDAGEECDDQNTAPDDGCSPLCQFEFCGDGVTNNNSEACDDGNNLSSDGCLNGCQLASCGDGFVLDLDGDGVVDPGDEACDDGAQNSDTAPNACRTNCQPAGCGDGVVDNGESCDDGNQTNGDACDNDCTLPACGDGIAGEGELCFNAGLQNFPFNSRVNSLAKDFDGDGAIDLAAMGFPVDLIEIAFNDSTGKFLQRVTIPEPEGGIVHGFASADFDQDGFLDIATINETTNRAHIFLNQAPQQARVFALQQSLDIGAAPQSITAFDIDSDADLDLATADANDNRLSLLINNGAGQFSLTPLPVGDLPGCLDCLGAGDFDGNGKSDLAFSSGGGFGIQVVTSLGGGNVAVGNVIPVGMFLFTMRVVDLNGDSKSDILASDNAGSIAILTNTTTTGPISFSTQIIGGVTGPSQPTAGDIDGDQDTDILVGTSQSFQGKILFLLQDTPGSFVQNALQLTPNPETIDRIELADFNADGVLDIASIGANSGLNVFLATAK